MAMLSFSNFGSNNHPSAVKVREAVEIVKRRMPDLTIDGEMQADVAVSAGSFERKLPVQSGRGRREHFDFPGSSVRKHRLQTHGSIGSGRSDRPDSRSGMKKPVFVLQQGSDVNDVVNMAAITAMEIQLRKKGENNRVST